MDKKIFAALIAASLLATGCGTANPNTSASSTQSVANAAASSQYTMAQVQAANTAQKCWTVIRGNVYDLTSFLKSHPGGETNIMKTCGIDGTSLFDAQHQGERKPEAQLAKLQIGVLTK
jgi:cytochrome b involved in lipid metabolism